MGDTVVEVADLRFSYGKTVAVDGISFDLARGEIVGFLGPNGAGKSTTVKILTGMIRPDEGTVRMLGMDVARERTRIHQRIGVCFEEKNLYLEMSAVENLDFFARLFGIRNYDSRTALERVGLLDRAHDRVKQYSKGMRQRLMVARALVNNPEIVFLDEPTDGLDPVSSRAIRAVIREEAARGAAVFLTTHDMNEADQLSDRVAFLHQGRIVAMDSPENLKLQHGRRSVTVRLRNGDGVEERSVALGSAEAGSLLTRAAASPNLMTIHTAEASLEEIFVKLTGRGLV